MGLNLSKTLLRDRVDFLYGFSVRTGNENEGDYPVYGSNGITGHIDSFKVEGPGVIIGRKGTVGAVNFSEKNFTPTDTAYYLSLKNHQTDSLKFWYYYLQVLGLGRLNTHSSVPGLSREVAYLTPINPPDIKIQNKIESILWAIDEKIQLNQKTNIKIEQSIKTIFDYWFVQFDFPNADGKPYKSSGGEFSFNAALKMKIPNGWVNGTLDDLGTIVGGSTPPRDDERNFSPEGVPWITPKDLSIAKGIKFISRGEISLSEKGVQAGSLKKMPKGSILLSSRAPIGYTAISSSIVTTNQGFKSFIPDKGYATEFIFYTIQRMMPKIISNASGSTFKEISGSVLKEVTVCLPEKNIVDSFSKKLRPLLELQERIELENHKLNDLRGWLLPMLMNGQITF
jgi:type I restriction enzyme S subunit